MMQKNIFPPLNPETLFQISGAYWASCAIHTAVYYDIFTILHKGGSQNSATIAKACKCKAHAIDALLTALTALNLLTRENDSFIATDFSCQYLSTESKEYLGYIILHHKNLMPAWSKLASIVKTGKPTKHETASKAQNNAKREAFLLGMFNIASRQAPFIAQNIDLKKYKNLMDLGGGPGTYAIYFCLHNPNLKANIFDLAETRPFAEQTVKNFALNNRINFISGNCMEDNLPKGHDVIWISQLLHAYNNDQTFIILQKAVNALENGGALLIQEFFLDDNKSSPIHSALFGLNMLINTEHGKVYTVAEISAMLEKLGLTNIATKNLPQLNGCKILSAIKP